MNHVLISADELRAELEGVRPPLVLDVRYLGPAATETGEAEFRAGHVPGAVWVDLDADLAGEHGPGTPGGRHPLPAPEDFEDAMRRLGVDNGYPVVVMDGAASLAAGRLWWMLVDAGHDSVRVLDGGFAAWREAGFEVETGGGAAVNDGSFKARPGQRRAVDAEGVAAAAARGGTIWDVRTPDRFRGDNEPIDPVAGHIPGAANLPAIENHHREGTFKSVDDLRDNFRDVRPGDVVYCGSGVTAAQTLVAMEAAGLEDVALYAGSWSDWITDPDRGVERG
ncbi:sulfurtransferase [Mariniluteicoccus flavus]